jgi:hypothetical protein
MSSSGRPNVAPALKQPEEIANDVVLGGRSLE